MKEVEEDFSKYILELVFGSKKYFCLWGYDLTDKNRTNRLLYNSSNQLLLFSKVDYLIQYILNDGYLSFDSKNTKNWAKSPINKNDIVSYDFNSLTNRLISYKHKTSVSEKTVNLFRDLLNTLDLIDDYCNDVEDENLESLLVDINYDEMRDLLMNLLIWRVD